MLTTAKPYVENVFRAFFLLLSLYLFIGCQNTEGGTAASKNKSEAAADLIKKVIVELPDANIEVDTANGAVTIHALNDLVHLVAQSNSNDKPADKGIRILFTDTAPSQTDVPNGTEVATTADMTVLQFPDRNVEIARPNQVITIRFPLLACAGPDYDFESELMDIAKDLEAQKITYNMDPNQRRDCSGMFNRVVEQLNVKLSVCEGLMLPLERSRSSALGGWYRTRGNFELIDDPVNSGNKIQIGSVMFFGRPGKSYETVTMEDIGTIFHIGIVVAVQRDDAGNVTSYHLFHAHGDENVTPADIEKPANWGDSGKFMKREDRMSFGYATEQWIGIAPHVASFRS